MFNFVISFFLTLVFLVLLLKTSLSTLALDKPNERSLHSKLIPRTGGLALIIGVVVSWVVAHVDYVWVFLVLGLVSISLVDDMRGLSVHWRFLVQFVVSGIFLLFHLHGISGWFLMPVLLGLVWMTNLYNFMDGSDGLAGGMALFGFSAYALAAYFSSDIEFAVMSACIASASLAFLLFNFHPARIFMGDAGSVPLGFLAGAMGLYGWLHNLWPAWFPVLVFSPFIVDASVTLFKRLVRGEKVWEAHRSHYYQRLVQMGWGHRNTAIAEYVLMLAVATTSLLLVHQPVLVVISVLALWAFVYAMMMWLIDKQWLLFLGKMPPGHL